MLCAVKKEVCSLQVACCCSLDKKRYKCTSTYNILFPHRFSDESSRSNGMIPGILPRLRNHRVKMSGRPQLLGFTVAFGTGGLAFTSVRNLLVPAARFGRWARHTVEALWWKQTHPKHGRSSATMQQLAMFKHGW